VVRALACRVDAIVTGRARQWVAGQRRVIEQAAQIERGHVMTDVTFNACGIRMGSRLARCLGAIVTTTALASDQTEVGMIDKGL
jgi:hypothetical protein